MTEHRTMLGIVSAVALLLTACGQDNSGEPRADAQALVGHADEVEVHVYCVEKPGVPTTPCSLLINYKRMPDLSAMESLWLSTSRKAVRLGTFEHGGEQWRFSTVDVGVKTNDQSQYPTWGWYCPQRDGGRTRNAIIGAMEARNAALPAGITSRPAARRAGCEFHRYPG